MGERKTFRRKTTVAPQQLVYKKGDLIHVEVTEEMAKKLPVLETYIGCQEPFEIKVVWRSVPELTVRWSKFALVELTIKNYQVVRILNRLKKES